MPSAHTGSSMISYGFYSSYLQENYKLVFKRILSLEVSIGIYTTLFCSRFPINQIKFPIFSATPRTMKRTILIIQILAAPGLDDCYEESRNIGNILL